MVLHWRAGVIQTACKVAEYLANFRFSFVTSWYAAGLLRVGDQSHAHRVPQSQETNVAYDLLVIIAELPVRLRTVDLPNQYQS